MTSLLFGKHNLIYILLYNKRSLFIFSFCFLYIDCCIKIPFKYYPSKINDNENHNNIFLSIIDLKMYGLFEIGTPKQLIHIPINFQENTFFLPQKSSYYYDHNNNLNLYDNNKSSTFSIINNLDYYEGENFQEAFYVNDLFYFEEENVFMDFYLSTSYYFPQMGGVGLQLYPSSDINSATPSIEKTFLRKLKIKNLINSYIWNVYYNDNDTNIDGYISIGDYPHVCDNYTFNYSINSIEAKIYNKIIDTKFIMDNVIAFIDNEKNKINEDLGYGVINVRLDYNFGGILAPEYLMKYLDEKIFNNNFCCKEIVSRISQNFFYHCDYDKNKINQIKKLFPIIKFENKILNNSFFITVDDLMYIRDNHLYFLITFEEGKKSDWVLGIPFLKKYNFSINQDSKKIYFYKKYELFKYEKSEKNYLYFILFFLFSLITLIIGIFFGIILINKNKRKKRKNEIDDNYEYIINDENRDSNLKGIKI